MGPHGAKFGPRKKIGHLLEGSAVLQGNAQQTSNDIVERHNLGCDIRTFDSEKEFYGVRVVMDAEIQHAMTANADLLGEVIVPVGEGEPLAHESHSLLNGSSGAGAF
jgi:hypothetical protein